MKYFHVKNIHDAKKFNEHSKSCPCIIKYYADWCGHCKNLKPKWDSVCNKYKKNKQNFIIAEINETMIPHTTNYSNIEGFPTIIYVDNNMKKDHYKDLHEEEQLDQWMNSKLKTQMYGGAKNKTLKNTRNKSCKNKKMTVCCPHMDINNKKQYAATNFKHTMKYKNKRYNFYTCCKECGRQMKLMLKNNPKLFSKTYVSKQTPKALYLKHRKTKKVVQRAPISKSTKKLL